MTLSQYMSYLVMNETMITNNDLEGSTEER